MKSRQVLPRVSRQTGHAKTDDCSEASSRFGVLQWLGVTLNEISEAPNEVAVLTTAAPSRVRAGAIRWMLRPGRAAMLRTGFGEKETC